MGRKKKLPEQKELFKFNEEIEKVRKHMLQSDAYLIHCIQEIYKQQTPQEQQRGAVLRLNNRGFMRSDAHALSLIARAGQFQSSDDRAYARKHTLKYARQVLRIAKGALP